MRSITRFYGMAALLLFAASLGCQTNSQLLSQTGSKETERPPLDPDEGLTSKQPVVEYPQRLAANQMNEWESVILDSQQVELLDSIENLAQWKQVWAVCHPNTPIPEVDLDKNLILVRMKDEADKNGVSRSFFREADGKIRTETLSTAAYYFPNEKTVVHFYLVPRE